MNKQDQLRADELKAKINRGENLTVEEELFYLQNVMGHTEEEAETIISITDNENKEVIID